MKMGKISERYEGYLKGYSMNYESRDQIEEKYRWDLSSMYESDEAFEQALVDIKTYPEQIASY